MVSECSRFASSSLHILSHPTHVLGYAATSGLGLTLTNPVSNRRHILHNQRPDEVRRSILHLSAEPSSRVGSVYLLSAKEEYLHTQQRHGALTKG